MFGIYDPTTYWSNISLGLKKVQADTEQSSRLQNILHVKMLSDFL